MTVHDPSAPGPLAPDDSQPHLLVVDDDRRLRSLLQRYLSEGGFRVTTAQNASEARGHLANMAFDLIVLDVMMPGETGLDLLHDLRARSEIPVLMLTARSDTADRIDGLERGADDYLTKPFEPRELMLRIKTIMRRARQPEPKAPNLLMLGGCVFDVERGELLRNGNLVRLTATEVALLRLFAAHPGETITRAALCAHTGVVLERSVDVQITRLRRKIEPDPRLPIYLQTARGVGYKLVPDRRTQSQTSSQT